MSERALLDAVGLDFQLPPELSAAEPPEARGLARDQVRLMISRSADSQCVHTRFTQLPEHLRPGDVLAINTSGTLRAALHARRADDQPLELHLSTRLPADLWVVEPRQPAEQASRPFSGIVAGEALWLADGASATLHTPYGDSARLWVATLQLPQPLPGYLAAHGFPIRYSYVRQQWPIEYYQTVYATEPGSAEMPSAGRAFTPQLLTQLIARGVLIVPLILHTGVASLEAHEPPYAEYYCVPESTAQVLNGAYADGRRVIAVGTTVVRALESVCDSRGRVHPGAGWTQLVIAPERRIRSVQGLLTGLHEPRATHLAMLEALAGRKHVRAAYAEALYEGYLWHEFGDLHLLLPEQEAPAPLSASAHTP